jgi:hypothetical protein
MTEDEAKKKQCIGPENCGISLYGNGKNRMCIASGCMAWEFTEKVRVDEIGDRLHPPYGDDKSEFREYVAARIEKHGRCIFSVPKNA